MGTIAPPPPGRENMAGKPMVGGGGGGGGGVFTFDPGQANKQIFLHLDLKINDVACQLLRLLAIISR